MTRTIADLSWPADRIGDALTIVIRRSGLSTRTRAIPNPTADPRAADEQRGRWIEEAAATFAVDAEEVDATYGDLPRTIRRLAPAVVRIPSADGPARYLMLLRRRRSRIIVLDPALRERAIDASAIAGVLAADLEAAALPQVEQLLRTAATSSRARSRARGLLLRDRLAESRLGGFWVLRPSAAAGFWQQLRFRNTPRYFALLVGGHTAQYALLIGSWWMIGRGMLHEQLSVAWLVAWALVLMTAIPFRLLANWSSGRLGIEIGSLLKRRLLFGALCLAPDATKQQGVGELLGRVIESEAVESLALSGAVLGITAATELALAAVVLGFGAAPALQLPLLAASALVMVLITATSVRRLTTWTRFRMGLTNVLVERIIGHRTRLAQQPSEQWHVDEDRDLTAYLRASADADVPAAAAAMLPRCWLLLAIACLLPAFVSSTAAATAIAISIGGVVLAYRALAKAAPLVSNLAMTMVAWREVEPMVAAAQPDEGALETFDLRERHDPDDSAGRIVVDAQDLTYRYRGAGAPVLRGCHLQIAARDRILLEGASGGGKSTLGSLLSGLRAPDSGLLLVNGLDRGTLGQAGWRRRIVSAPQFHDNHVFSSSFAFNVLLGRAWPPRAADLRDAEEIARELGLGELLDRMPGGMLQMVGDMGWQLSHGERSRLFMARTLLQRADLVILDESFAALDPETLDRCAACVLARAPALLVIAHP